MIKTAQDAYLAGRQAAMEKLAYDWLGDSGLSLGGLSEYKSTSDPAKVRELQRNLEALAKDRAKAVKDWKDTYGTDGLNTLRYFAKDQERYTGEDIRRQGIASFAPEGTVPAGAEALVRGSKRVARGIHKDGFDHDKHIQKLRKLRNMTGGRQAALDLLEIEPRLGVAPVTADVLSTLTASELYNRGDVPSFTRYIKHLTSGVSGDKREKEIKNLVKKLKAIKTNKRNLNEEIESEKSKGYKTYLTPQNINRLAILGGTAGGAYLGDFTPRAFGVSLGGAVVGNLLGGAIGSGINAFRGGEQSNLVPLIGSTAGALGGGLSAGKYLS